jgi:maltose alpha-D-glucosyltransferase/alpha-amylase
MLDDKKHWYKDATIYQIHVRSFKDSNHDGIGDFPGLMQNLDYFEELGVTAIWVQPFFASPQQDGGYDISDYYNINPDFGTIEDFRSFVAEAHRRGLKVIIELVINHTSSEHEWFQRARKAPKGSPERNWYVWTDDPTQYKDVRIIFTDTEPSNWTYDKVAEQYYWHRFFSHQPDLNYDNPEVQAEIFRIIDFWAEMGVDGFRLDAIPYLFEREGTNCENLPETHDFLKKIFKYLDETYPGIFLLAEANMWPEDSASYYGNGDECHMNFHFPIMPRMYLAMKTEDRYPIIDILAQTPEIPETCQWGMFLRNHDELTLEMVTEEERDFMYKNYAPDLQAKINVGIRRRLAPLMDNDRKKIELLNVLLYSMPGTPFLYYGDEIGMGDNFYLKDRDGVRTPMQWSAAKNAGFSDVVSHKLFLPVIDSDEYNPQVVNVDMQRKNPNSLFHWTKNIIAIRKKYKAFGRGKIKFLHPENPRIMAFIREYENEKILVVVNLSKNPQAFELDLSEYQDYSPTEIFSQNPFPLITSVSYPMMMGGHGYYWFALEKSAKKSDGDHQMPVIEISSWEDFTGRKYEKVLAESILPAYFPQCRWYGGKAKNVQKMQIRACLPFGEILSQEAILLIDVTYTEGFPETYLLPVSFDAGEKATKIRQESPKAVICEAVLGGEKGVLYDAVYSENFRRTLFALIADKEVFQRGKTRLFTENGSAFEKMAKADKQGLSSKLLSAEQSNTSIVFGNKFFLKLFRKLEGTINPDVEVSRFLTEKAHFIHNPPFSAALHLYTDSGHFVLGMLQELVENQGDAWTYVGKELGAGSDNLALDKLSDSLKANIELLAKRTAEMHLALASQPHEKDFEPEEFSLHYQSSLYAGLFSLVRANFQTLTRQLPKLPAEVKPEAEYLDSLKPDILKCFKRLTFKKIDAFKIRTHGDYHLGQVLFTGNDFVIIDFEGEPARPASERRLKRSPLKDVAGMLRSFHYAAYAALLQNESLSAEDVKKLQPQAETWYKSVYNLFLDKYLETAGNQNFIPTDVHDLKMLLETFILEKAVYELNYELVYRPDWVMIPINGIKAIMKDFKA